MTDQEIADLHRRNRGLYEAGKAPDYDQLYKTRPLTEDDLDHIPGNSQVIPAPPLQLELDTWLYCSDLHVPFHNRPMLHRLMQVARNRGVKHLVVGGDFYDFASLSSHPKTEAVDNANRALSIGGELIGLLCSVFERVYFLPGNHDLRLAKKLDTFFSYENLIWAGIRGNVTREQIVVTDYDYIYIGPPETGWVVGHPRFFSSIPAKGVSEVALIQRRNVVGAHNHLIGLMQSRDGRYWAIDPGHMTEASLTPYKMQSQGLSRFPEWRPGFLLVERGVPRLMTDGLARWEDYGC